MTSYAAWTIICAFQLHYTVSAKRRVCIPVQRLFQLSPAVVHDRTLTRACKNKMQSQNACPVDHGHQPVCLCNRSSRVIKGA